MIRTAFLSFLLVVYATAQTPKPKCAHSLLKRAALTGMVVGAAWGMAPVFSPDPVPLSVETREVFPSLLDWEEDIVSIVMERSGEVGPTQSAAAGYEQVEQPIKFQAGQRTWWQRLWRENPPQVPEVVGVGHSWKYVVQVNRQLFLAQTDLLGDVHVDGLLRTAHEDWITTTGRMTSAEDILAEADRRALARSKENAPVHPFVKRFSRTQFVVGFHPNAELYLVNLDGERAYAEKLIPRPLVDPSPNKQ